MSQTQYNLLSRWRHYRATGIIKWTFSLISFRIGALAIVGKSIPVLSPASMAAACVQEYPLRVRGYFVLSGMQLCVSIKQKRALSGVAPLMVTRPSFLLLLCDNSQALACHVIPLYPLAREDKLRNCSDCVIRKVSRAFCTMRLATQR